MNRAPQSARPFDILLVEDNPGDVRLVCEALEEGELPKRVYVTEDGVAALDILRGRCETSPGPWPDLVLLDLNLPRLSGHDVLRAIRADPRLSPTPVIIFTSSAAEEDVSEAYRLHANCYVTKPSGLSDLMRVIGQIESFWLGTATLPCNRAVS